MTFLQDCRLAVRMLLKRPGLAFAAILSLVLAIGANATVYTWIQGVVLRPLPGVVEQDRIVHFENRNHTGHAIAVSYPDFADYRREARGIALVAQDDAAMSLTTEDRAERVYGALVSGNYFDVLGVRLALGRGFLPDEDRVPNARPVVVLSHALWQRRLDADPAIVGRAVTLNGHRFTVVGVTAPEFIGSWGGVATELWVPMMMQPTVAGGKALDKRGDHWMTLIGRLQPGTERTAAQAELNLIARRLSEAHPNTNRGMTVRLNPFWQAPGGAGRVLGPVVLVLLGVVAIVLLIACANVANLLLGLALDRRRETAIRLALGAARWRLTRQLLTEGLLLAAAGGIGGLIVARWSAGLLTSFLPPIDLPIRLPLNVDGRVVLFTIAVSGLAAVAFALAPALQASRADVATALKEESGTSSGSRRKTMLRHLLVVGQIALSVVLLTVAGLFLQSLRNARHTDPGFNTTHVLLAGVDLFPNGYTQESGVRFYEDLLARLRTVPGVQSAAVSRAVPINLGGGSEFVVAVEGYQPAPGEDMGLQYNCISPDYFRVMDIPILRGRDFTAADDAHGPKVVIVNETMAARFWPGRDPLDRHVRINSEWVTVVGVVKDITYHFFGEPRQAYMYLPISAYYQSQVALQVRTAGEPGLAAGVVREAVRSLDRDLPLFNIGPISVQLGVGLMVPRIAGTFLGLFGGLGLILATVGLFGVVSYMVGQRWRELGIRMAIGARPRDVLALVVRHGLGLAALGIAFGAAAAAGVARLIAGQLYGVSPSDPATFAGVALFMLIVAAAASFGPARRASRLDPLRTLRHG